jgi:hypothetical protein
MAQKSRPVVDLTATCSCGAVTVAIKGPVYAMFMCSCEDCQKATGAGHSAAALCNPDDVTITGNLTTFTRPSASGATFTRSFCPICGTGVGGKSSRAPRAILMPVGLFGAGAGWFTPSQLIFARSHRDWDIIAADLPQHATYREGGNI